MKMCKFLVAFTIAAMVYALPALAGYERVLQTATDLGPNARPCSFAFMESSGWIAILRTDTAYAHAVLLLKTARDAGTYLGLQTGAGISACSGIPSLTWLTDG